jgi:hypothetical protein
MKDEEFFWPVEAGKMQKRRKPFKYWVDNRDDIPKIH